MKFVAAYLLACLGDNPSPGKDDVRRILDAVGVEVEERLDLLFAQLEGKDVAELIAAGREKLAHAPCGAGAAAVVAPVGAAGAGDAAADEAKEEKKEEKAESDEEDDDTLFNLFD